jgi:FkbM family methyltransferase
VRSILNGLALVSACRSLRDKAQALVANIRYAAALVVRGKSKPFITSVVVDGLTLTLDWAAAEHVPIREVFVRREYAPDPTWLPQPSETVVDVGANAGVFSVDAARRVGAKGRLIAVEPNPVPLRRLKVNVVANGYEQRVRVVPAALGARPAIGVVVTERGNTTTGHVVPAYGGLDSVPIVTLDTLCQDLGVTMIDLLKIDVEGSELEVLQGGPEMLRATRRVVVEVNEPSTIRDVIQLLQAAGFSAIHSAKTGPDSGADLVFASRS